uniref:Uncharacterized protein n=1 Tax=viral metagenome TaxID=1070528 RepID=A0A6C0LQN8_9ZZZZ
MVHTNKNKIHKNITRKKTEIKKIINGRIIKEEEGWIITQIYGEPYEMGFAHGYLLRNEIKKIEKVLKFLVKNDLHISLDKYLHKTKQLITPKIKKYFPEYYLELKGIAEGAKYGKVDITLDIVIGWNSLLSMYDVFKKKKPERCSAFIACGNSTEKGDIVMGHNTHSDFATGQMFNIILYMTPCNGNSFVMQTAPGYIASGTDWFLCSSGIIGCETTIGKTNFTAKFGTPYFCRIRKAMQYGKTLDDYVKIMCEQNAGDYACSWLLGNIKENEIMLFELGLNIKHIQRTHNGVYYGMNSAMSEKLRKEETNDQDFNNIKTSSGSRNKRLNDLLNEKYKEKINMENTKKILADHYDELLKKNVLNSKGICKHVELEAEKTTRPPFYPFGCTDSKVVNSELAAKLTFLGKFGCGCGEPFVVKDYVEKHPEYKDWGKILLDRPNNKWLKIEYDYLEK